MNTEIRKTTHLGSVLTVLAFSTLPVYAQTAPQVSACVSQAIASDNAVEKINALGRAKNLARQAAEATNGGLGQYRADTSMHGAVSDAPCVDNSNGTWTFTVKGGEPGFTTPTKETVVTVDGSSWTVTVDYNGAVR